MDIGENMNLPSENQGLIAFCSIALIASIIATVFFDPQFWIVILILVLGEIVGFWPLITKKILARKKSR